MTLRRYFSFVMLWLAACMFMQPACAVAGVEVVPPPPIHGEDLRATEFQAATQLVSIVDEPENKKLSFDLSIWNSDLGGRIDSRGMNLKLAADTSISSTNSANFGGILRFNETTQLRLDSFKFEHRGHTNRAVTFDNRNFAAGSAVKIRNNLFGFWLAHSLSDNDQSNFRVLCGVRFSKLNTKIEQSLVNGVRVGELAQSIGMPYIGVEGNVIISETVSFSGSANFFDFNKSGEANRISDFDLAFEFGRDYQTMPSNQEWYGLVGYRYFMLHDDSDGNSARVVYSGPTLGIRGKF